MKQTNETKKTTRIEITVVNDILDPASMSMINMAIKRSGGYISFVASVLSQWQHITVKYNGAMVSVYEKNTDNCLFTIS